MKKTILGILMVGMLVFGVTSAMFFQSFEQKDLTLYERIKIVQDRLNAAATNGTSGSVTNGADCIVNIMIYPHQADVTVYNDNLSESNAYEHFDNSFTNGEELEGETPYSTTFDIIIIMQYDLDHIDSCNISRVWCYCNESQLSISSQLMEKSDWFYDNETDDSKINFFLQDADGGAGSGFTIDALEQIDDIEFKPYAQY